MHVMKLNLCILQMFEDIFSLDVAHMLSNVGTWMEALTPYAGDESPDEAGFLGPLIENIDGVGYRNRIGPDQTAEMLN